MKDLNQVVTKRLEQRIASGAINAQKALERIDAESRISQDFITNIGKDAEQRGMLFDSNGEVTLLMPTVKDHFGIHENAVYHLAERLSVPSGYLRLLVSGTEQQKALAARILNDHSDWTNRKRVLVRAVGDEVRGVLSDQYRRLNSHQIIGAFVDQVHSTGAQIVDGHFTDTKLYIESLHPKPIIFDTPRNGQVAIAFGARLSTSDYGDGALDLRFYFMQGICLNGMVRESVMRQIHLGSKLPEDLMLSQKTYDLDTATMVSTISDLTAALFSEQAIRNKVESIRKASSKEIDIAATLTNLQKAGKLFKGESKEVETILLNNNPDDGIQGEGTIWKLSQAISAYGRNTEEKRSRELQEVAGALIEE